MKTLLSIAILTIATPLPASAALQPDAPVPAYTVTRLGQSSMRVSCGRDSGRDCHYLILKSLCQERFLVDGTKERTCNYMEAAPPFRLKSGESKTVAGLPADFIYTMKRGAAPTASECLAAPTPH